MDSFEDIVKKKAFVYKLQHQQNACNQHICVPLHDIALLIKGKEIIFFYINILTREL